jgi:CubicO group peptidase (beta-lactamase class C family)
MRKLFVAICTFIVLFSLNSTAVFAETVENEVVSTEFDRAIQEIIDTNKAMGATATLVMDGEVVITKGYGYADEALELMTDGNKTGFRIGSVSKTFVAVAALIAVEDGKLDMQADISKYLPEDFPKFKYTVTMQNLLTHTAGFEDYITGIVKNNISDTEPLQESLRKYRPEQIFRSGEVASYSNYGIALAGYVIECATGEDYAEFCKNKIFQPLGMNRTTFLLLQDIVDVSKAYTPDGKEVIEPFMNLYPEGSVVTTAEDMAIYIKWLLGEEDTILKQESKQALFAKQFSMAEELEGIGYVWNRKTRNDSIYYDKKGETLNFYSRIVLYPEQNTGLFLSFNTYVPEKEINSITAKVTDLVLGKKAVTTNQGGATIDIDGCYANAWSNFNTVEKLLKYVAPNKLVDISGSLSKGYTFNGEKIKHLGNNAYDTPIGTVKFFEKGGKTLLATDFSQTYLRINGFENKGVALVVTLLFISSSILSTLLNIIFYFRKKKLNKVTVAIPLIQVFAFCALGYLIITGITQFSMISYALYINISAWVIGATTLISLVLYLYKRKQVPKYIHLIHTIISIAFCLIMIINHLMF